MLPQVRISVLITLLTLPACLPISLATTTPLVTTTLVSPPPNLPPLKLTPTPSTLVSPPASETEGSLYLMMFPSYEVIKINSLSEPISITIQVINISPPGPGPGATTTIGAALLSSFSHFSQKIAYWVRNEHGELWISDLAYAHPQPVFVDTQDAYLTQSAFAYSWLRLIWSPDDRHLIVDASLSDAPSLIYNLQAQTLAPWPWNCNMIGHSPRSGRVALWCAASNRSSNYAVMEWGGKIWYTDQRPTNVLVKYAPGQNPTWGWSPAGDQVAFFDPQEAEGNLLLASAEGIRLKTQPGSTYLANPFSYSFDFSTQYPIQWSRDGQKLLIYANSQRCPDLLSMMSGLAEEHPCWQVLDAYTGERLWSPLDIDFLWPDEEMEETRVQSAVFSPTGEYLALGIFRGGPRDTVIANIQAKTATILGNYLGSMYWAP